MFVQFFSELKSAGVPVTLREYLTLMEAMEADLAGRKVEDFYYLSRSALVKDERNLDKFDRVFGHVFKGLDLIEQALTAEIPEEWLRKISEKYLTEEEKKMIEAMGGLDKLLETLRKRLEEQKGRHQGGKKWIGTGGTSPFGNAIKGTAHKGYLDIHMRPERHNTIKVLALFDIGGSMDWHVKLVEELFSAAKTEVKHLAHFYFHNCLYAKVWKENRRRFQETTPTWDVLHKYPHDYKVIFVGDASMSPYEITTPGGSVEHFNEEAGAVWLERVTRTYPACVWLNPVPEEQWDYTYSIRMVRQMMGNRMYPLTLVGLDKAMRELVR